MRRFPMNHGFAYLSCAILFASLEFQIHTLRDTLASTRESVSDARTRLLTAVGRTGQDLATVAEDVARTQREIHTSEERHQAALAGVERIVSSGLGKLREGVKEEVTRLESVVGTSFTMSASIAEKIGALQQNLQHDPSVLSAALLAPTVQVRGNGGVGAGTLIHSAPAAAPATGYRTYVLTAFHVVAKVVSREGKEEVRELVQVRVFHADLESSEEYEADLLSYDETRDIAILKLRTEKWFPQTAHLAGRETLRALSLFTPLYAVGCPLGHNPMPSLGEITSTTKDLNGQRFWMMSAPTIYGNSGGGVYLATSHELIGVSSMICVYDNFVSLPIPHLGIFLPLDAVHDWLDAQCLQFLYRSDRSKEECDRDRHERRKAQPLTVQLTWDF
ncbi:MAG: trypsin-like peptidase domain-containing protein [Planctomycetes bacterium]|nr:trypsin-like peptidase domain-containing protein [Planctomycetota bacterium]